ncbi:hypothetical protein D9M72_280430 [compost metagenome]
MDGHLNSGNLGAGLDIPDLLHTGNLALGDSTQCLGAEGVVRVIGMVHYRGLEADAGLPVAFGHPGNLSHDRGAQHVAAAWTFVLVDYPVA